MEIDLWEGAEPEQPRKQDQRKPSASEKPAAKSAEARKESKFSSDVLAKLAEDKYFESDKPERSAAKEKEWRAINADAGKLRRFRAQLLYEADHLNDGTLAPIKIQQQLKERAAEIAAQLLGSTR